MTSPPPPPQPRFPLGPLPSKAGGEVIGYVNYKFGSREQRAAFVAGKWPT